MQELRQSRRRNTASGRTSLFSGLVYCADCGAKMYFAAGKTVKRNQEHFVCSNYKSGRGSCQIHFIRDVVLERIVLEAIQGLATLREATDITELNQTPVNRLIQRIEVHGNEKKHSHNGVKVDIYFTAVGMVNLPDEQEPQKIMQEVRRKQKNTNKIISLTA